MNVPFTKTLPLSLPLPSFGEDLGCYSFPSTDRYVDPGDVLRRAHPTGIPSVSSILHFRVPRRRGSDCSSSVVREPSSDNGQGFSPEHGQTSSSPVVTGYGVCKVSFGYSLPFLQTATRNDRDCGLWCKRRDIVIIKFCYYIAHCRP